mmetsp:Transcript_12094/g.15742  ORF Transcript_12094/g.15742 Transcript_12094/m.15742 type:complete len:85 (+) Transcript_12094:1067-1321(+)
MIATGNNKRSQLISINRPSARYPLSIVCMVPNPILTYTLTLAAELGEIGARGKTRAHFASLWTEQVVRQAKHHHAQHQYQTRRH